MPAADAQASRPLYQKIARRIEGAIAKGSYSAGERLPTERELAARYGVNRHTASRALEHLSRTGVVERIARRGTFVPRPGAERIEPVEYSWVDEDASFTETIARTGLRPRHRLLEVGRRPAGEPVAEALGIAVGDPVAIVERLSFACEVPSLFGQGDESDTPVVFAQKYFRLDVFPQFDEFVTGDVSLRKIVHERYRQRLWRARITLQAEGASERHAKLLGVPVGHALMRDETVSVIDDGRRAQLSVNRVPADALRLTIEFPRSGAHG